METVWFINAESAERTAYAIDNWLAMVHFELLSLAFCVQFVIFVFDITSYVHHSVVECVCVRRWNGSEPFTT